ncbi:Beta-galactosidase [Melia azedarach]|uniref:Beta-galactosidase n=1 Tax=Melia azedarach TaxID=155640 RepID=A0ACC1Y232_MELAZ|nr:Beta-galactosidase [Melia azedarach]
MSFGGSLGLFLLCSCLAVAAAIKIEYDAKAIIIDGQRKVINAGSIHYPRSTPEMWPDLIQKAKDGGLDAIDTYIFWDVHEPQRREYNFAGNLDFVKFFKIIQDAGLYGILRIGPYVCAEWNYGGFPLWLHNTPGIELRTNNEIYENEMQIFTTKIINMCKEAKLFASQGGPIILAQIENEYGNIMEKYGEAGKEYIKWCAKMAVAQNISEPWIMCQQSDAPSPMIDTCNGFYCDQFKPNSPKSPKMWTENWTGWFKLWGGKDPYRSAEDLAFSVARFFQLGGVLNNYYMYHGGTNFGRTAGGPYIVTSYDYHAPLDEYGNLNQPKWGHLKQLHAAIKQAEQFFTSATEETKNLMKNVAMTKFTINATGEKFCMLSNVDNLSNVRARVEEGGDEFFVPAWSVTFVQNCSKEVYNTAKVNTQSSVMVKKQNDEDEGNYNNGVGGGAKTLSWMWTAEPMEDTLNGRGTFKASQLLDQKDATFDTSDYLWYMTTIDTKNASLSNATLRVITNGHALHAYVNGKLIGSRFSKQADGQQTVNGDDYSFIFEKPVSLISGYNVISLLSATIGLANYGAFYDSKPTGIVGGSVTLIGNGNATIDLTTNQWSYKVGLNGESKQFHDPNSGNANWSSSNVPQNIPMTWYKTTFKTPSGKEPVVVDLLGMGKGHAWVNGNSIGRYWPTQIAENKGCDAQCNYRGSYSDGKCRTNCGNPSQRWYHVPRSYLNTDQNGDNTLILFEEVGGAPWNVSFQVVTVGTVCGNAYEGNNLELHCQGDGRISEIQFASFGDPQGTCGSFKIGNYEATQSIAVVERLCIGRPSCGVNVSQSTFGFNSWGNLTSRLAVQAVCE